MKLLVLTFYYEPDLSAGSFRTTALVKRLREVAPTGTTIDVITTLPNRYHTYSAEAPRYAEDGPVRIWRIALPPHRNGFVDQSRSFLAYAREVARITKGVNYDLVFATSSRLMTAALGSWVARRARATLYLDIRDIFVDTIGDLMATRLRPVLHAVLSRIERWTIRRADTVNLVSPGFAPYFRDRYPRTRWTFFTNGIDDEFVEAAARSSPATDGSGPSTILYAGNLGDGQGIHEILPALARAMATTARFRVIGDGGRRRVLEQRLADEAVTNVELIPPIPRRELLDEYLRADVLFLHLNNFPAFEKVLPSKVFEYAALGKPIWAGVAGYSREFIEGHVPNAATFQPCDVDDALRSFGTLRLASTDRRDFVARYARASISDAMARDIVSRLSAR